jgi:SAM-dependent methyltransferase
MSRPSRWNGIKRRWASSGHRTFLTRDLAPHISRLSGVVVDLGGGPEAPHDLLWPTNARRVRIDLSDRDRPEVVADAAELPLGDASVEGVVMCELLEHVPEPHRVVGECRRVLLPGGVLCGSVPFIAPIHGTHDYFRYTEESLRRLFQDFTEVEIIPHGNSLGAAWRLLSGRSRGLRALNPLIRWGSRRTNPRCPEGYVFVARKEPRSPSEGRYSRSVP